MNGEMLSDLLLALVCSNLAWRHRHSNPAVALGLCFVGAAAWLGVAKFGGLAWAPGPHRFASGLAAGVGLPLLAYGVAWPQDPLAKRAAGASHLALFLVVLAVGLSHLGLRQWLLLMPIVSAGVLAWALLRPLRASTLLGWLTLVASFGLSLVPPELFTGPLSRATLLHLSLALALWLLLRPSTGMSPGRSGLSYNADTH